MAKLPKILSGAGEDDDEAIQEGLTPIEAYAGGWPFSKISGDPMDNVQLAALIESLGVTPESIQALVEAFYDEAASLSVAASRALQKIEDMMGNPENFDFVRFVEMLDAKTEVTDFEAHAQDWDIHLTDEDKATLASFIELWNAVQEFAAELNAQMTALESLVRNLQDSMNQQAIDLAEHISSGMHIQPEDQELIMDHINDMGEYRHLTIDEYYDLMEQAGGLAGGTATVYDIPFPDYIQTTGGENQYKVASYQYILFSGKHPMAEIDEFHLTLEEMAAYGRLVVENGTTVYIKAHQENTGPSVLIIDGKQYDLRKTFGEAEQVTYLDAQDIKRNYFYRLRYSETERAFVITGVSRVADSSEYDDDRSATTVSALKRAEERSAGRDNLLSSEIDGINTVVIEHTEQIEELQNNLVRIYVQETAPDAASVPEGSLWAW